MNDIKVESEDIKITSKIILKIKDFTIELEKEDAESLFYKLKEELSIEDPKIFQYIPYTPLTYINIPYIPDTPIKLPDVFYKTGVGTGSSNITL
jgi:hypothetical protein